MAVQTVTDTYTASVAALEATARERGYRIAFDYRTFGGVGTVRLSSTDSPHTFTGATNPAHPKTTGDAYRNALRDAVASLLAFEEARR